MMGDEETGPRPNGFPDCFLRRIERYQDGPDFPVQVAGLKAAVVSGEGKA